MGITVLHDPWLVESMAVEPWIQRYDCKVICKFSTAQWSAPHIPVLFKGQLYMVPTKSRKSNGSSVHACDRMLPFQLWLQPCCLCGLGQFLRSHKLGRQYEEHDSESTSSFKKYFLHSAHLLCSFCSGRSECHFFCFTMAFL